MSSFRRGFLYSLASAILFGFVPLITLLTDQSGASPYMIVLLKSPIALIPLLIILRIHPEKTGPITRKDWLQLALVGFLRTATEVLLFLSYRYVSTGNATVIHFTYPLFVLVLGALIYRERITWKDALCFALCTAGIAMMFRPGEGATPLGFALALSSGVCFGLFTLFTDKFELIERIGNARVTLITYLYSFIYMVPFCLATGTFSLDLSIRSYALVTLLTLLDGIVAMMLLQAGIRYAGGRVASLVSVVEPVTSIIVGIVILSETATAASLIGSILILSASILLVVFERESSPPPEGSS